MAQTAPIPTTHPLDLSWTALTERVTLRTQAERQLVDVTELVAERVRRAGIRHGLASVEAPHTTTAVLSPSLQVIDGRLSLGPRQRVLLLELDGPRVRTLSILVVGLTGARD
jgi:thiamine phosphate synthase YjbQ (UPF0047 family)